MPARPDEYGLFRSQPAAEGSLLVAIEQGEQNVGQAIDADEAACHQDESRALNQDSNDVEIADACVSE